MDRYEEALERARQGRPIDEVFPELKEGEDERIRKGLIEIFNSALGQDFLQRKAGLDRDKVIAYLEKQKEQKPASISCGHENDKPAEWNEKDDKHFTDVLSGLKYAYENLINNKSLDSAKDIKAAFDWMQARMKNFRPQPKAEWTEEDEAHLNWLCRIIHSKKNEGAISLKEESELGKWIDKWINHSPQPHWKPSKEQMNELFQALIPGRDYDCDVLQGLHDDLVKLMEGKI